MLHLPSQCLSKEKQFSRRETERDGHFLHVHGSDAFRIQTSYFYEFFRVRNVTDSNIHEPNRKKYIWASPRNRRSQMSQRETPTTERPGNAPNERQIVSGPSNYRSAAPGECRSLSIRPSRWKFGCAGPLMNFERAMREEVQTWTAIQLPRKRNNKEKRYGQIIPSLYGHANYARVHKKIGSFTVRPRRRGYSFPRLPWPVNVIRMNFLDLPRQPLITL